MNLLDSLILPKFNGFEEAIWWSRNICKIINILNIAGRIKCKVKKRVNVALLTWKPPHIKRDNDKPI